MFIILERGLLVISEAHGILEIFQSLLHALHCKGTMQMFGKSARVRSETDCVRQDHYTNGPGDVRNKARRSLAQDQGSQGALSQLSREVWLTGLSVAS